MRLRFWVGLAAVLAIAAGAVAAAAVVYVDDRADFDRMQEDEAARAARQAEAVAALSIGQLASAAAFFQAEGEFTEHEFDVIAEPLLEQGALSGTAFLQRVPGSRREEFERRHGAQLHELRAGGPRRALQREEYFPIVYAVSERGTLAPVGYDLGSDPNRAPFLHRARDLGKAVATPPLPLILGGTGINVYRPVYRDGAPTATVAQRRAALTGFATGAFRVDDLAASAFSSVADEVDVQLRLDEDTVLGARGDLADGASAPVRIADRTWVLVVRDPDSPGIALPLLLAGVGISLAALLTSLIISWSRNERMQELQRQASLDSLTGLKNRRRFEEDLRVAMARGRRDGGTGAVLMLDLDHFKEVNDSHGHQAGDRMIQEIAAVLRDRTRESDVLARIGGDEFAIVLPRCTPAEARVVAESVAQAIAEHRSGDERLAPVTASVGVAMFGEDPRTSIESVISEADTAMYAAKDGGRDGVRVFDPVAVRDEAEPSR
ncbi:MAG TPA: diguanylate cyclase [Solirubrobacterales bacterium]|nr:diguanylate cyclase [Solirubrobacterales bacterium]